MKNIIIGIGQTKKYVAINAIMYFEGESNYSHIHCEGKKEYTAVGLKKWEERLTNRFVRIHRRFLVNPKFIVKVFENQVFLKNGTVFDISRRRRKSVLSNQLIKA